MTLLRQQGFGADMLEVGYALGRAASSWATTWGCGTR